MRSPASLLWRALIAVLLMVGFYVLALGVSAFLIWIVYADLSSGHVHGQILIACVVGAGLILWSVVPRLDRFVAPGPQLLPEQHPRLFAELTGIARSVEQQMPAEVYLFNDVNAWVAQRGGIMGFGSRRVMALGLPLLAVTTVGELRAVLAHEFGHYYGGDTKLGPWVYKTRAAIDRTLQSLARGKSRLYYIFEAYAKLFLRITMAISRAQEQSADELAARVAGAAQLAGGLVSIRRAALSYQTYVNSEVAPVIDAHFRPAMAEGFRRYLAAPSVSQPLEEALQAAQQDEKQDPYATHPPLKQRLAALQLLPPGSSADMRPALSLLDNEAETEQHLLSSLAPDLADGLQPIAWEETGEKVFIPLWRRFVAEHGEPLTGITARQFTAVAERFYGEGADARAEAFAAYTAAGAGIADPNQRLDRAEVWSEARQQVTASVAMALSLMLYERGWSLHAAPGELYFERGGNRREPFAAISKLIAGEMNFGEWWQMWEEAAIADVPLVPQPRADRDLSASSGVV